MGACAEEWQCPPMTTRTELLALAIAILAAAPAQAQQVVAGRHAVTVHVTASLVMPPLLRVRQAPAVQVIARRGDTLTVAMDVAVAANLDWTLNVLPTDAATTPVRVQDENGTWRDLRTGSQGVTVAAAGPANDRPVRIVMQATGAQREQALRAIALDLIPAGR